HRDCERSQPDRGVLHSTLGFIAETDDQTVDNGVSNTPTSIPNPLRILADGSFDAVQELDQDFEALLNDKQRSCCNALHQLDDHLCSRQDKKQGAIAYSLNELEGDTNGSTDYLIEVIADSAQEVDQRVRTSPSDVRSLSANLSDELSDDFAGGSREIGRASGRERE